MAIGCVTTWGLVAVQEIVYGGSRERPAALIG